MCTHLSYPSHPSRFIYQYRYTQLGNTLFVYPSVTGFVGSPIVTFRLYALLLVHAKNTVEVLYSTIPVIRHGVCRLHEKNLTESYLKIWTSSLLFLRGCLPRRHSRNFRANDFGCIWGYHAFNWQLLQWPVKGRTVALPVTARRTIPWWVNIGESQILVLD